MPASLTGRTSGRLMVVAIAGLLAVGAVGCKREGAGPPSPAGQTQPAMMVAFVNARCPIMGSPIDPANVPPSLTRTFKGQRVAFCCPVCPGQWDSLTDAEKEAKLAAVKMPATQPA